MYREAAAKVPDEISRIERLRAHLAEKRAANQAKEAAEEEAAELAHVERDIEIEDKLAEAYAAGIRHEQILDLNWRGIGRCIGRIPRDANWRRFVDRGGILKGELKGDPALHEELSCAVMLVPDGKKFLELAREYNPNAPFDLTNAVYMAMRGERDHEKK